jgi:hypothetical protein
MAAVKGGSPMIGVSGRERKLLEALVLLVDYRCREDGYIDSGALSECEEAMDVLVGYGIIEWLDDVYRRGRWTSAGEGFRKAAYRDHPREDFGADFSELPSLSARNPRLVEEVATIETSTGASLTLGDRERFLLTAFLRLVDASSRSPRAAIWALMEYGFIEKSVEEFVKEWGCNACFVTWSDKAKRFWDAGRVIRRSHRAWSRGR